MSVLFGAGLRTNEALCYLSYDASNRPEYKKENWDIDL